jgi:hypothetical protein
MLASSTAIFSAGDFTFVPPCSLPRLPAEDTFTFQGIGLGMWETPQLGSLRGLLFAWDAYLIP